MITKSKFLQGSQCKKLFWLSLKNSHLLLNDSEFQQFIFKQGHEIGDFAKDCYPNGIDVEQDGFMDQINQTKDLIHQHKTIFEAAFLVDQLYCKVDILNYDDGWTIIEVKSSTSVKPVHIIDLSFQYYLLSLSGLSIKQCLLMHLNNQYTYGEPFQNLFKKVDVTETIIDNQLVIEQQIFDLKKVKSQDSEPTMPIGKYCNSPYPCPAYEYCWKNVPSPSIFDLRNLSSDRKFNHYYQNEFKIPDLDINLFNKRIQKIQITSFIEDLDYIDIKKVKRFYDLLSFPISFLDFECFQSAIPKYKDSNTYQQIPFQYSLYSLSEHGELDFYSFIHDEISDPREPFIVTLIAQLPKNGSIIVFNKDLEQSVLSKLIDKFPMFESKIVAIKKRIIDLADLFMDNAIFLRDMNGDFSLKSIISAIDPNISFDLLSINDGGMANSYYHDYLNGIDSEKRLNDLKDYSRLDVYSMVIIYTKLKSLLI